MPLSNNVKGYISLVQSLLITFGAMTMFSDPHNYYGLGISIVAAIVGAIKHWADTQGTPQTPEQQPPSGQT